MGQKAERRQLPRRGDPNARRTKLRQSLRADSSAQVAPYGGLGTRLRRRARAVLDLTEEPGFLDRVEPVGARFAYAFETLDCTVRRRGLFVGSDLKCEQAVPNGHPPAPGRGDLVCPRRKRSLGDAVPSAAHLLRSETKQFIVSIGIAWD